MKKQSKKKADKLKVVGIKDVNEGDILVSDDRQREFLVTKKTPGISKGSFIVDAYCAKGPEKGEYIAHQLFRRTDKFLKLIFTTNKKGK